MDGEACLSGPLRESTGMETEKMVKSPMKKDAYLKNFQDRREWYERVQRDPARFKYHIQPPMGWLNDPNGLCQKDGVYHIYFQYCPFYPELGSIFWGHMTTRDFIHFEEQEPAVYSDTPWDCNGPYSGSAFEKDGTLCFFYTGNVRYEGDYNYVTDGREQNTILITSEDGYQFSEKQLLMTNDDYPADMSRHVRDPQVFRENGRYFMIQGARSVEDEGAVLLFESGDLIHWSYKLRFQPEKPFGYMWECPNYLKIGEQRFLITCPQGVPRDGIEFANVYQCGWFPLDYDFEGEEYKLGDFHSLDRGFDFYAPQVFQDESGRWILLGWMAVPDSGYEEPTLANGWIHAMTIPRELYVNESGLLCQKPLKELESLRKEKVCGRLEEGLDREISPCFELNLLMEETEEFEMKLRESVKLTYRCGVLQLNVTECGMGRTVRSLKVSRLHGLRIFSDTLSLEIFVNDGEDVFTSRVYDSMENLRIWAAAGEIRGIWEYYSL